MDSLSESSGGLLCFSISFWFWQASMDYGYMRVFYTGYMYSAGVLNWEKLHFGHHVRSINPSTWTRSKTPNKRESNKWLCHVFSPCCMFLNTKIEWKSEVNIHKLYKYYVYIHTFVPNQYYFNSTLILTTIIIVMKMMKSTFHFTHIADNAFFGVFN